MALQKIVSGGQTGSDRGGLNAAIALDLKHGGYCPKGRRAEDGVIPPQYKLKETVSSEYPVRTAMNVIQSDGTVVFTYGTPKRGSALTLGLCKKNKKPVLHIDLLAFTDREDADLLRNWIKKENIRALNVAGSRESTCPGIQTVVERIIILACSDVLRNPGTLRDGTLRK